MDTNIYKQLYKSPQIEVYAMDSHRFLAGTVTTFSGGAGEGDLEDDSGLGGDAGDGDLDDVSGAKGFGFDRPWAGDLWEF